MDTSELTTRQKSVILAKLMRWKVVNKPLRDGNWKRVIADKDGNDLGVMVVGGGILPVETELKPGWIPDLYEPKNMAAAWRVLNWAMTRQEWLPAPSGDMGWLSDHTVWLFDEDLLALPPAEAQVAWLDKVLSLAMEAGLVAAD